MNSKLVVPYTGTGTGSSCSFLHQHVHLSCEVPSPGNVGGHVTRSHWSRSTLWGLKSPSTENMPFLTEYMLCLKKDISALAVTTACAI